MRTEDKFVKALEELKRMHRWHNCPFWLVATENDYVISRVEPRLQGIAKGTAAILYDVDMEIIKTIENK